jgi:murein hydrolase activator
MKVHRPSVLALLACWALLSGLPLPGQDVSEFEKRISRINEQIKDLQVKIREEEKKESGILSSLARIGLTKRLIRNELTANAMGLEKTKGEIGALKKEIFQRRTRLDDEKRSVSRTLVTLYKFGKFDFLQFALKYENLDAFFAESKHLAFLARYQESIISGYLQALAEMNATQARLEGKTMEIAALLRTAESNRKELEAEEQKNRSLVQDIQRSKKTYIQAVEELNESARQLQSLIKKIIDQEYTLNFALVPLYEKKGKLAWPIEGRIITRFGLQKHPRFNTTTMNNGIEIAPKKEKAVILAVHPGRVAYADAFEGYGNLIIVDHGMAYYSLYGHCSDFLVNKGDAVKAAQPIALVGDSGSMNGTCLYFELRFKTKALDPLQWLKRR